jgi:hypothetical protein
MKLARGIKGRIQIAITKRPLRAQALLSKAIKSPDILIFIHQVLQTNIEADVVKFDFLMLLADYFSAEGDDLRAISYLNVAKEMLDGLDRSKSKILVEKLVKFHQINDAAKIAIKDAIDREEPISLGKKQRQIIIHHLESRLLAEEKNLEHGQDLLIAYLHKHANNIKKNSTRNQIVLIEIGTTRENISGQGSTRKFAELCQKQNFHFITIDMDPHNTHYAGELFKKMGVPFNAVTAKGEEYLKQYKGIFDFIFLDAYDFDHGNHSDLRQSRYKKYLGSVINDDACHQMHYECAMSVNSKLADDGLVCIDDTWLDEGRWAAKGTLAMPYLLDNGFKLIDVRNRAVLLARDQIKVK